VSDITTEYGAHAALRGHDLPRRWAAAVYLAVLAALSGWAPVALAQGPTGVIRGRIVEQGAGTPVFGARVTLLGTAKAATTDSGGRFAFGGLAGGLYVVQVSDIGYTKGIFQLELGDGEAIDRAFELTPRTYGLEPMTVEARRRVQGRRYEEFNQRAARGLGTFITEEQIAKRDPVNLMELLRTVRGVRAECAGSDCIVKFQGQPTGCEPKYILDNLPSDSQVAQSLMPRDLYGVEIYRGSAEVPAEYGGMDAACGVIVIWTKSGPG
jgi:hypothetical protein